MLQSDYRLRGYSLSDGQPVAAISLGYDDASGVYVGGSAIATVEDGHPELLALHGNIGYAVRIAPEVSLDGGLLRAQYFSGYGADRNLAYTELYLGVSAGNLTSRIRFSPDYFGADTSTLYAELDGGVEVTPNWLISAHVGLLGYLQDPPAGLSRRRLDWRLGGTRRLGRYGVHLDVVGRIVVGPDSRSGAAYPWPRSETNGTAVVASLTRAF